MDQHSASVVEHRRIHDSQLTDAIHGIESRSERVESRLCRVIFTVA